MNITEKKNSYNIPWEFIIQIVGCRVKIDIVMGNKIRGGGEHKKNYVFARAEKSRRTIYRYDWMVIFVFVFSYSKSTRKYFVVVE